MDDLPETTVTTRVFDVKIEDNFQESNQCHIHIWTLDRETNPILVRIQDFPVFRYAQLPFFIDSRPMNWDNYHAQMVFDYIKFMLKDHAPVRYDLVFKQTLYYYKKGQKYPMLLLIFNTMEAAKHFDNAFKRSHKIRNLGYVHIKSWEGNINQARKLFTVKKLKYAQWFSITGKEIPPNHYLRISKKGIPNRPIRELICSFRTLKPIDFNESASWIQHPRLLAFDIETYSNYHKAMPNKYNDKHVVYLNSLIYQEIGKPETMKKYIISLVDCDPIEGVTFLKANSEYEIITLMEQVFNELDPDIITGYNIMSYDFPYLHTRINRQFRNWPCMGRLKDVPSTMYTKIWKSSAYGYNEINYLNMDGRISVDALPAIKRNNKFDMYTLDFVSKTMLKKGKHEVSAEEMFKIYERLDKIQRKKQNLPIINTTDSFDILKEYENAKKEMTRVAAYCVQDSILVVELFEINYMWIDITEMSNITGVCLKDINTGGQQQRCLSQIYDLAANRGFVIDYRANVLKNFKGGNVYDPIIGIHDNSLCFDFNSLYPSIMQAFNICFSTLILPELNSEIPDSSTEFIELDAEQAEELNKNDEIVENDEDVIENFVEGEGEEEEEEEEEEVSNKIKIRFIKKDIHLGILPQLVKLLVDSRNHVRKVQMKEIEKKKQILENYLKDKNWEKLHLVFPSHEDDSFVEDLIKNYNVQLKVLDKRQNALKVSANSMFGFTGVQNGAILPLLEGAMAITGWGRKLITEVALFLQNKYNAIVVYGDTDSCMITMNIQNPSETHYWGKRLEKEINGTPEKLDDNGNIVQAKIPGLFQEPLKIEFEKPMRMFNITKKRYGYFLIDTDGNFIMKDGRPKLTVKGLLPARRDNPPYVRRKYSDIMIDIMLYSDIKDIFTKIISMCNELLRGEISPRGNLTMTRSIGSEYKSKTYFLKVFADELRRIGKPAHPGDRVEYIIVASKDPTIPLGQRMRTIETWEDCQKPRKAPKISFLPVFSEIEEQEEIPPYEKEDIDYMYYLEHTIMNPIDQLFYSGYKNKLDRMQTIGYQPRNSNHKAVSISKPVEMYVRIVYDYLKLFQKKEVNLPLHDQYIAITDIIKLHFMPMYYAAFDHF